MKQTLIALSLVVLVAGFAWAQTNRTSRTNKRVHDRNGIDTTRQLDKVDSILLRRDSVRNR